MIKTYLGWAGNKTKLIPSILKIAPSHKRLVEPFMGSGSFLLNRTSKSYLGADINEHLTDGYKFLKSEGEQFLKYVESFFTEENGTTDGYKRLREIFNHSINHREKAAIFIFMNKHAFGSICRYNNKTGHFNVPPRQNLTLKKFPRQDLKNFIDRLSDCEIFTQSFEETFKLAKPGDFIYCDPPYLPEGDKNGTFTAYTKLDFNLAQHKLLVELAKDAFKRLNVTTIISNHNSPLTQELYKDANELKTLSVYRSMGRYDVIQKEAKEVFAVYGKVKEDNEIISYS